jgi:hypothetical protein
MLRRVDFDGFCVTVPARVVALVAESFSSTFFMDAGRVSFPG